ncbi:MAG TPA: flavin reductase family protein [Bacteroidetes bacterium]|nr:flavin reductase family protein [Bacteroidota bacterium]
MTDQFKEIQPQKIPDNPFKLIGSDWMLITAKTGDGFNSMTANWGGLGFLWEKNVCFCFIRPQRYTFQFLDRSDLFALSFFPEKYREALELFGTKSGRDVDKVALTGLHPLNQPDGTVWYREARLVIVCRKIYYQDLIPGNFIDTEIDKFYQSHDYHRMFIGEIQKCLVK